MNLNPEQDPSLSVIIPAYNEESRLPETVKELFAYFQEARVFSLLEVLIIDDGSTDATLDLIMTMKRSYPQIRLIHLDGNQGKGAAVQAGLLKAEGQWILVADADQSTPWSEMERLYQEAQQQRADLVMGSRALALSQVQVRQAWWREGMGKLFNFIVRSLFKLPFLDTQCGFKLLKNFSLKNQFVSGLKVRGFAWDVELIVELQSLDQKIIEIPVIWRDKLDSRVHPIKDSGEMLYQLIKMRLRKQIRKLTNATR